MSLIITGIVVIAIVCLVIVSSKKSKDWKNLISSKDVENLTAGEVISFFKKDKIVAKLKENSNFIAVAIREKSEEKIRVIACLFDKEKNSLVDMKFAAAWNTSKFDDDLLEMFGDKKMIILQ